MDNIRKTIGFWSAVTFCILGLASVPIAMAATTAPTTHVYNGHLLDSAGAAVTTEMSIRFSYWSDTDYVAGDVTATGAIHTTAATYAGWTEVHTVTPDSNGFFSLELGSVTALPDFSTMATSTLTSLHLQVEVKTSAAAATAYELLDSNTSSSTIDRSPVLSVPFARNADLLDKREIGSGSGSIPLLESGAVFNKIHIPAGTIHDAFTIDSNDSNTKDLTLKFGETLAKTLIYSQDNSRFEFNANLYINGSLTTTGLINGIDITTLGSSDDKHLKVSSGAGLTISIAVGTYRLNGTTTNFAGSSAVVISDEATNYVFLGSGGLSIYTSGYPTDESIIRLADVVTTGGSISSVTDRRTFNSDDRERANEMTYHPEFANAVFKADGSNNVGQLHIESDTSANRNYYYWTSSITSLQDYDIKMRATLPANFLRWKTNPIVVAYKSSTGLTADNTLDISVLDTAGSSVVLTGSASTLANTSWATTTLDFSGSPTWTAGSDVTLSFKLSAKSDNQIQLGSVKLQYVELIGD
ncbi:MAG: hypothetical protein O2904_00025 [bacterium]|nr:hypothetical protein [bacterium]